MLLNSNQLIRSEQPLQKRETGQTMLSNRANALTILEAVISAFA